jgi:acyl-coenzyme A synthetase/AMP-(fatty) acid ligase
MLNRPGITEAAVVGLPSEQWGQKVAAVLVLDPVVAQRGGRGGQPWGLMDMRRALRNRLATYKIPQQLKILNEPIPRNAMGKGESYRTLTVLVYLADLRSSE